MGSRQSGIILVAVSAVLWSTAGLFVRMADLDTWTIVGWRSLFSFLTLASVVVFQNSSNIPAAISRIGLPGLFSISISAVSTISYVVSLQLTTVANVMIVYAALPFVATLIAFVWVKERVTVRFLVAGGLAFVGIVIMAGAASSSRDVIGIAAACVMTASFATQLVHAKLHPTLDMTIVTALSAAACGFISVPLMRTALPAPNQLLACALFGVLTTGLAYVLVLAGGRLISSGEAGFISMLDVVLGPLWVWYFFAERPSASVIFGGIIVLGAVAWYLAKNPPEITPVTVRER